MICGICSAAPYARRCIEFRTLPPRRCHRPVLRCRTHQHHLHRRTEHGSLPATAFRYVIQPSFAVPLRSTEICHHRCYIPNQLPMSSMNRRFAPSTALCETFVCFTLRVHGLCALTTQYSIPSLSSFQVSPRAAMIASPSGVRYIFPDHSSGARRHHILCRV